MARNKCKCLKTLNFTVGPCGSLVRLTGGQGYVDYATDFGIINPPDGPSAIGTQWVKYECPGEYTICVASSSCPADEVEVQVIDKKDCAGAVEPVEPPEPVPAIDVEDKVICKDGVWTCISTVYTDGVVTGTSEAPLGVPCDQPVPDYEVVQECRNGFINVVTYSILDGTQTELTAVPTSEKCPPDTISIDTEVICNEATNEYEYHQITSTNGVPAAPVITPAGVKCDEDKPEITQIRECRLGSVFIVTNSTVNGTTTELSAVDTGELCPPDPKFKTCFFEQKHTSALDNNFWTNGITTLTNKHSYDVETELVNGQTVQYTIEANDPYTTQVTNWGDEVVDFIQSLGCFAKGEMYCDHHKACANLGVPNQPGDGIYYGPECVFARYYVIQTCDPNKLPKRTTILDSSNPKAIGAFKDHKPQSGTINQYWGCTDCDGIPEQLVTTAGPVDMSTIAVECLKDCSLMAAGLPYDDTKDECTYQNFTGCDAVDPEDKTTWVNIYVLVSTCPDGTTISLYEVDEDNNLTPYNNNVFVGKFVDCDTGDEIDLPALCPSVCWSDLIATCPADYSNYCVTASAGGPVWPAGGVSYTIYSLTVNGTTYAETTTDAITGAPQVLPFVQKIIDDNGLALSATLNGTDITFCGPDVANLTSVFYWRGNKLITPPTPPKDTKSLSTKGCYDKAIFDKLCAIEALLQSKDCSCGKLVIGDSEFSTGDNAGSIVTYPYTSPPEDISQISTAVSLNVGDDASCVDPNALVTVRWCIDHSIDASTGHTGFNISVDNADPNNPVTYQPVLLSHPAGTTDIGPDATPHNGPRQKYWADFQIPAGELINGVAFQTSGLGAVTSEQETIHSQDITIDPNSIDLSGCC